MPVNLFFRVHSLELNIRTEPIVAPHTRMAILKEGHLVQVIEKINGSTWVKVETQLDLQLISGYVNSTFLTAADDYNEPTPSTTISAVHLRKDNIFSTRNAPGSRAFPLFEPGMEFRNPADTTAVRVNQIHKIVNWLRVDLSHRYKPSSTATFCNIYAYDFCYLAQVYLPRVWWTESALNNLNVGYAVSPMYGTTVRELNANAIFDWLNQWGPNFGWRRVFNLDTLQNTANNGSIGIIVAKRKILNLSGHITVVVPEVNNHVAYRVGGRVTRPLQSQAGVRNFQYDHPHWWTHERYIDFAFWVCE